MGSELMVTLEKLDKPTGVLKPAKAAKAWKSILAPPKVVEGASEHAPEVVPETATDVAKAAEEACPEDASKTPRHDGISYGGHTCKLQQHICYYTERHWQRCPTLLG